VDYTEGDREGLTKDQVVEDIKTIIDARVKALGSAEPTIKTKVYNEETHILVQIPTPEWPATMTKEQRNLSTQQYIAQAKRVIGKVVNLEFKEYRTASEIEAAQELRATYLSEVQSEIA